MPCRNHFNFVEKSVKVQNTSAASMVKLVVNAIEKKKTNLPFVRR